ncbi:hypothetical protein OG909_12620 [Streptomyces sp. NBC_01754]|uniref:hypothetical protein n=1 Tax=Streptomyces sp. NBC_01754 TaxID=2975930 RepID=UPI002DD7A812|nr:hypothetical protein [Streptomyces sp. NBC_01754]WSC93067.1 hypothetical protein OG909_12620 [Streptomyces sp. NBC_01754]
MENNGTARESTPPDAAPSAVPERRSFADWAWLAFLALLMLVTGLFVAALGPLLAIACSSCQDGVRDPAHFDVLAAVAWYGVPLTVLGSVVGMFFRRGGTRAAAIGFGVLAVLLVVILALGVTPA